MDVLSGMACGVLLVLTRCMMLTSVPCMQRESSIAKQMHDARVYLDTYKRSSCITARCHATGRHCLSYTQQIGQTRENNLSNKAHLKVILNAFGRLWQAKCAQCLQKLLQPELQS